jgi:hypothetical protein
MSTTPSRAKRRRDVRLVSTRRGLGSDHGGKRGRECFHRRRLRRQICQNYGMADRLRRSEGGISTSGPLDEIELRLSKVKDLDHSATDYSF